MCNEFHFKPNCKYIKKVSHSVSITKKNKGG